MAAILMSVLDGDRVKPGDGQVANKHTPLAQDGRWYQGIERCKAYADEHHIPMVAYWTSGACTFCQYMQAVFKEKEFGDWQKTTKYLWAFDVGTDPDTKSGSVSQSMARGVDNYVIIKNPKGLLKSSNTLPSALTGYPYLWLHWKVNDSLEIDTRLTARMDYFPFKVGNDRLQSTIETIKYLFRFYRA